MPATKQLRTLTPAQYAFVKWLYEKHPNVAKAAEEHHASLNGFMDSLTSTFNNILDKAPDLLKQYVAGQQQIDELKLNIERAKQGQYPVSAGIPQSQMLPAPAGVPLIAWVAGGGILLYLLLRK